MSGGGLYDALVIANTIGSGSANPGFSLVATRELNSVHDDEAGPERTAIILPPQALLQDLNARLKSMARLFGYDFNSFNMKGGTPQGILAVTSSPLKIRGGGVDDLGMADIQIDVSIRAKAKIFEATPQDIVDSVQKTIIEAAKSLLGELFYNKDIVESDALSLKYMAIINDISATFKEQIIGIDGFDGKYKPIVSGVALQLADLLCKAKQEVKFGEIAEDYKPPQPDFERALLDLHERELDLLSTRQRNVTVAIFADDPARADHGYMVEIAWPLNTKSSMDRRGAVPSQDQKRPNFWIQVNIHYDNKGNVLSVDGFGRGASPNPIDMVNAGERLLATQHAIINDFRWAAFMQLAEAILKDPSNAKKIISNFGKDIHIDNLGLMSPFGKERDYIAEINQANRLVLEDAEKNGGLSFADDVMRNEVGYDFVDVLVRVTGQENLRDDFNQIRFQPSITQDNLGTNTSRNASARTAKGILMGKTSEPIQNNLRDKANTERFAKFVGQVQNMPDSEFIIPFKKMFNNAKEKGNGLGFWRGNKKDYLANLEKLRAHLETLMQAGPLTPQEQKLLGDYEKLTIFAMHLEHNIKPQPSILNMRVMRGLLMSRLMPGFVADRFVTKLTDAHYSYIRQIITAIMDKRVIGKQEAQTFSAALEQIFNCKSGKDRTGVFADFKAAWLVVMNNERHIENRPFDFNKMDHYISEVHRLLPHYVDKSVGNDVAEYNTASKGPLGQDQGVKGVKLPIIGRVLKVKNLIYEGNLVAECDFAKRNLSARLKDVRWEALEPEAVEKRNKKGAKQTVKEELTANDESTAVVLIKGKKKIKISRRQSQTCGLKSDEETGHEASALAGLAKANIADEQKEQMPNVIGRASQMLPTFGRRTGSETKKGGKLTVRPGDEERDPTSPTRKGRQHGSSS